MSSVASSTGCHGAPVRPATSVPGLTGSHIRAATQQHARGGDGTKPAALLAAKTQTKQAVRLTKKKEKKKDSEGTNEAEREHERVRFSVLALQQKAPGAEPQCSTVADSHPARPIFTLRCGIAGFSLSPRCFLLPLLQVNS